MITISRPSDTEGIYTAEGVMRPFMITDNATLNELEFPPGLEVHPHGHPWPGLMYCVAGEFVMYDDTSEYTITAGTAVSIPADYAVGIRNNSGYTVRCLSISSPPRYRSADELRERIMKLQKK